jgi:acetyl-CoA C-acetyltransferase
MTGGKAIVIAIRRTAIGRMGGLHRARRLDRLAAPLIEAVLADARLDASAVDEVIIGNAAGGGGNPARLIALAAGLPESVPAVTIDRQCASGLDAIVAAARMIETGSAQAVIAGGAESPSTAPWRVEKPANLYTDIPRFFTQAPFTPPEMASPDMIEAAENVARERGISRERQDAYALESHRRAVAAQAAGLFEGEILPHGNAPEEARDEGPRASLSLPLLARMPALLPGGTVTAGNSCAINDGACLALLVSEDLHERLGAPPGLRLLAAASAGIAPRILGLASVPAFRLACKRAGINPADLEAVELNEAFASQVLATVDELGLDPQIVNAQGGALAFGHAYGASGAMLVSRLHSRIIRNHTISAAGPVAAMIAAAGGLGVAAIFQPTSLESHS